MKLSLLLALPLLLCGSLFGAEAKIKGPERSDPGDLIVLDASESDATDYKWLVLPKGKTYLPVEGGTKVVFASGKEGVYTFVLCVAKEGKVDFATHDLTIGAPAPAPPGPTPPGPTPPGPVPPGPTLPDGKFKFARFSFDEAGKLPTDARSKSKELADNFESTASALAAGGVASINAANSLLKTKNNGTLGTAVEMWRPFFVAWGTKADGHNRDGSLKTAEDYVDAYNETAAGLRGVK